MIIMKNMKITTHKWGQIGNFDLTLNSDLGIDAIVDTIVQFYNQDNF